MSRNFELLQKLGKEQEVVNAGETAAVVPAPAPASEAEATAVAPPAEAAVPASPRVWTPPPSLISTVPTTEPIAALAQQVFIAPGTDAPRAVVFATTEPGAGCTWVCAQAARALAGRVAASICVVDANFTHPTLHDEFQVARGTGLGDTLLQSDPIREFIRPTSQGNLWLLTAGAAHPDALLASDRMRLRVAELRSNFDFVLFDTPAMSVTNDAIALGSFCDGVVVVVKAHVSRRSAAKQAIADLTAGKARVLGAVLNQRTYPIPQRLYDWL